MRMERAVEFPVPAWWRFGQRWRATKTCAKSTSSSGLPVQHPPHKAAEEDGAHANDEEISNPDVVDHHCLTPTQIARHRTRRTRRDLHRGRKGKRRVI